MGAIKETTFTIGGAVGGFAVFSVVAAVVAAVPGIAVAAPLVQLGGTIYGGVKGNEAAKY